MEGSYISSGATSGALCAVTGAKPGIQFFKRKEKIYGIPGNFSQ